MEKRWFDVTVTESYHATYKVLAIDRQEADDLANEAVNNGTVDPTMDGVDSYDRETSVEEGDEPEEGDRTITEEQDEDQ